MDPINIIVVGVIALGVIFGAKKIPEMARSIGRAQGEFKKGLKEGHVDDDDEPSAKADAPKEPEKD
jgi:twin arginine-targeting protein translocase, TatA/E family